MHPLTLSRCIPASGILDRWYTTVIEHPARETVRWKYLILSLNRFNKYHKYINLNFISLHELRARACIKQIRSLTTLSLSLSGTARRSRRLERADADADARIE